MRHAVLTLACAEARRNRANLSIRGRGMSRIVLVAHLMAISVVCLIASTGLGALHDYGIHTFDDETGLWWLDWTETTSISYNEMIAMMNPGGAYEGYRYATRDDLVTLFAHAGLVDNSSNDEGAVRGLLALLGSTYPTEDEGGPHACAFTGDIYYYDLIYADIEKGIYEYAPSLVWFARIGKYYPAGQWLAFTHWDPYYVGYAGMYHGHAIVTATSEGAPSDVPEPVTLIIWSVLGAIGLFWRCRF